MDAEVVWLDSDGMAVFDALHSRVNAAQAPDRHAERRRKLRQFNRYPEQAA
jgi:hypothetical protein